MNTHNQAIHNNAVLADRGVRPPVGCLPPRAQCSESLLQGDQNTIMFNCDLRRHRPLKAHPTTSQLCMT